MHPYCALNHVPKSSHVIHKVRSPRKKYKHGLMPVIVALTLTAVYYLMTPSFPIRAVTTFPDFLSVLVRPMFSSNLGQAEMYSFTTRLILPQGTTSTAKVYFTDLNVLK